MEHRENTEKKRKSLQTGNLTKLLPAAAVIAAVSITSAQPVYEKNAKDTSISAMEVVRSEELTDLLAAAYSVESENKEDEESGILPGSKKKKSGITVGKTKVLPQKTAALSGTGQGSMYTPVTEVPKDGYKDGVYQGSGTGFGGTITVQVTVSGGKITAIEVLSAAAETPSYFASAKGVISNIISSQTPNADAVSGATYSSNGIIEAVQNALGKAGGRKEKSDKKDNKKNNKKDDRNDTAEPVPTVTPRPVSTPKPDPETGEEKNTSY